MTRQHASSTFLVNIPRQHSLATLKLFPKLRARREEDNSRQANKTPRRNRRSAVVMDSI
jgi:hypothetical protein